MAKKSIFEKMGLVEKVVDEEPYEDSYENQDFEEQEKLPEVNTEGVTQDNLIADIYSANDLTDMDKSIFKVEEIKATLPSTMTTEAMKNTVFGILGSFKLTAEGLLEDANNRITILQSAHIAIKDDNNAIISERTAQIEEAKRLIEGWQNDIAEHEKVIVNSSELIEAEIKRIDGLSTFIGGE